MRNIYGTGKEINYVAIKSLMHKGMKNQTKRQMDPLGTGKEMLKKMDLLGAKRVWIGH